MAGRQETLFVPNLLLKWTLGSPSQILTLSISLRIGRGEWVRCLEGSREGLGAWVGLEQQRENHSNWRIREETKLHRSIRDGLREGL